MIERAMASWFSKQANRNLAVAVMTVLGGSVGVLWSDKIETAKELRESEKQHRQDLVKCKEELSAKIEQAYKEQLTQLKEEMAERERLKKQLGNLEAKVKKVFK